MKTKTFTFNEVQNNIFEESLTNLLNNLIKDSSEKNRDKISEVKLLLSLFRGARFNENN